MPRGFAPSSDPFNSPTNVKSTAVEASRILKATPGTLYWLTCNIGATSGWLMLFDLVGVPSDGGVAPDFATYISSDGVGGLLSLTLPTMGISFPKYGIVAVFSSTGPFTKTASATASFFAGLK